MPCDYDVENTRQFPSIKLLSALDSLLRCIKYSSSEELQYLIHVIRYDSPIQEVVKTFQHNMQALSRAGYVRKDEVANGDDVLAVALQQIPRQQSWSGCPVNGVDRASSMWNQSGSPSYFLAERADAITNSVPDGNVFEPSQACFQDMLMSRPMTGQLQVQSVSVDASEPSLSIRYNDWTSRTDPGYFSQGSPMWNATTGPNGAEVTSIPALPMHNEVDEGSIWRTTLREHETQYTSWGGMRSFL